MEKLIEKWHYEVTWYTRGHQSLIDENIEKYIVEVLKQQSEEIGVDLVPIRIREDVITFNLDAKIQLNIGKIVRNLQKKVSKVLSKHFMHLKPYYPEMWDKEYIIVTDTNASARTNARIENILLSLDEVAYYDLDEAFSEDLGVFSQYLGNKNIAIIDCNKGTFLIDKDALKHEINLNCFACTKLYQYGCCSGSPCSYSPKNKKMFNKHYLGIEQEVKQLDENNYKNIMRGGGFFTSEGEVRECNGHCALLVEEEGIYKCIAHKYALEHEVSKYDLCPLSCLMYPLEIMELFDDKNKYVFLLTSVVETDFAKNFGRWGSYECLETELRCLDKNAHNEHFKAGDYKPVYEVNKGLLIHEFGRKLYDAIEKILD